MVDTDATGLGTSPLRQGAAGEGYGADIPRAGSLKGSELYVRESFWGPREGQTEEVNLHLDWRASFATPSARSASLTIAYRQKMLGVRCPSSAPRAASSCAPRPSSAGRPARRGSARTAPGPHAQFPRPRPRTTRSGAWPSAGRAGISPRPP